MADRNYCCTVPRIASVQSTDDTTPVFRCIICGKAVKVTLSTMDQWAKMWLRQKEGK